MFNRVYKTCFFRGMGGQWKKSGFCISSKFNPFVLYHSHGNSSIWKMLMFILFEGEGSLRKCMFCTLNSQYPGHTISIPQLWMTPKRIFYLNTFITTFIMIVLISKLLLKVVKYMIRRNMVKTNILKKGFKIVG